MNKHDNKMEVGTELSFDELKAKFYTQLYEPVER